MEHVYGNFERDTTIESCNYAAPPPLLCMLALGKTGHGAHSQDSDIYM